MKRELKLNDDFLDIIRLLKISDKYYSIYELEVFKSGLNVNFAFSVQFLQFVLLLDKEIVNCANSKKYQQE